MSYRALPFERPGTLPFERAGTLPYSPEYGFLDNLPPNAIRERILGESCDLPTSARTNEYRDVQ
jgi:hypothetical protein